MMRVVRQGWLFLLCTVFFLAAGCAPQRTPAPVATRWVVRVVGSGEAAPLAQIVADYLAQTRPNVETVYVAGNQRTGWAALSRGAADLALVTAVPETLPPGVEVHPLVQDAVVLVVHPQVHIAGLSLAQARELFSGRVPSWELLGGPAVPVVLISREEGSGIRMIWEQAVMGKLPIAAQAEVMPTAQHVIETVRRRSGAVGYVSAALARTSAAPWVPVGEVRPTPATLREGRYPVRYTVYAILPARPSAAARLWMDALHSAQVQNRLAHLYLPAGPELSQSVREGK